MTTLSDGRSEAPAEPLSGFAIAAGVLAAYGAFALLISIVAAFSNGAHANQQLSAATWKQLGTGGGIVAAIALFLAWGVGGLIAGRLAGRDGTRHGVWVFVVGVVLVTVVSAAITWLPDTAAILRNLRLLGLPIRRAEWRDVGTVAAIASLVGMAAGAIVGGRRGARAPEAAPVVPAVPAPVEEEVVAAPQPVEERAPEPLVAPEPVFAGEPQLFEESRLEELEEGEPEPVGADETPAWLQFVEEREREIREREPEPAFEEEWPEPEPAPWTGPEPVPSYEAEPTSAWWSEPSTEAPGAPEPPAPEQEPAAAGTSWWPSPEAEPERSYDEAWALPDVEAPAAAEEPPIEEVPPPEEPTLAFEQAPGSLSAFPPSPEVPVPEPVPTEPPDSATPERPPLDEHADWSRERGSFQSPPDPDRESALRGPETTSASESDTEEEEEDERRRQREEAARAYERAREEQ